MLVARAKAPATSCVLRDLSIVRSRIPLSVRKSVLVAAAVLVAVPLILVVHWTLSPPPTEPPEPPRVPQRLGSLEEVVLFAQDGTPLVYYCGDVSDDVEFYDAPLEVSLHSGTPCLPLTKDALDSYQAAKERRAQEGARARERDAEAEAEAIAERQAREAAAAEQAFRERYVRSAVLAQAPSTATLLAVSSSTAGTLKSRIASALQERGGVVDTNVLTNSVFEEGIYDSLAAGDPRLLQRLHLSGHLGPLLLVLQEYGEFKRANVGNLINTKGYLTATIVSPNGLSETIPTLEETGAGFDQSSAQAATEERLVEALLEHPSIQRLLDTVQ